MEGDNPRKRGAEANSHSFTLCLGLVFSLAIPHYVDEDTKFLEINE